MDAFKILFFVFIPQISLNKFSLYYLSLKTIYFFILIPWFLSIKLPFSGHRMTFSALTFTSLAVFLHIFQLVALPCWCCGGLLI